MSHETVLGAGQPSGAEVPVAGPNPQAALLALYDRYAGPAFALALRMLGDPEPAEVCMQAAFLALAHHPALRGDPAAALPVLLQEVHRHARQIRRANGTPQLPPRSADGIWAVGGSPAAATNPAAARGALQTAGAGLAPRQRQVLELAYLDCLTEREIAAHLALPLAQVQIAVRTGMRALQAALAAAEHPPTPADRRSGGAGGCTAGLRHQVAP